MTNAELCYSFEVSLYRRYQTSGQAKSQLMYSIGTDELEARRRILDYCGKRGLMVKSMTLVVKTPFIPTNTNH